MTTRKSAADRVGPSVSFGSAVQATSTRGQLIAGVVGDTQDVHTPKLELDLVSENPDNPREELGDITSLVASFKEVGQVLAITVASAKAYLEGRPGRAGELRPGATYVVVDGHRRLAAAREAGLTHVKVAFDDGFAATDESLLEAAFVANFQRQNLSDLEEAHALEKLVKFYGSQGKVARRLSVSQPFISQRLSLLSLNPELQADLQRGVRNVEHVRGLASIPQEQQRAEADRRAQAAQEKQARRRTAPAPHNAVMGSTGKTRRGDGAPEQHPGEDSTHNGVMGSSAGTEESDTPVVTGRRQSTTADPVTPAPGATEKKADLPEPRRQATDPLAGSPSTPLDTEVGAAQIAKDLIERLDDDVLVELAVLLQRHNRERLGRAAALA